MIVLKKDAGQAKIFFYSICPPANPGSLVPLLLTHRNHSEGQ